MEELKYLKGILSDIERYDQAARLIEFDQNTICPELGQEESGEMMVSLRLLIHEIVHEKDFVSCVEHLYKNRDGLDERDRRLIEWLYREQCRTIDFSSAQEAENKRIKNQAYLNWLSSRENDSCEAFIRSLSDVLESEKARVSLWNDSDFRRMTRSMPISQKDITSGIMEKAGIRQAFQKTRANTGLS